MFDLPETGEYILRVYDTAGFTAQYGFQAQLPSGSVDGYSIGDVVSDAIDAPLGEDLYVLTVPDGQFQISAG